MSVDRCERPRVPITVWESSEPPVDLALSARYNTTARRALTKKPITKVYGIIFECDISVPLSMFGYEMYPRLKILLDYKQEVDRVSVITYSMFGYK